MKINIDYDPNDIQIHRARVLLGDPIAEAMELLIQYANRINKKNENKTSYTGLQVLGVMTQPVMELHDMTAMVRHSQLANYMPTMEEQMAARKLTGKETITPVNMFVDHDRCMGRTLRIAVETIGYLLANPGKWVQIEDHDHSESGNKELAGMINRMLGGIGIPVTVRSVPDPNSLNHQTQLSIPPINKQKVLK